MKIPASLVNTLENQPSYLEGCAVTITQPYHGRFQLRYTVFDKEAVRESNLADVKQQILTVFNGLTDEQYLDIHNDINEGLFFVTKKDYSQPTFEQELAKFMVENHVVGNDFFDMTLVVYDQRYFVD